LLPDVFVLTSSIRFYILFIFLFIIVIVFFVHHLVKIFLFTIFSYVLYLGIFQLVFYGVHN